MSEHEKAKFVREIKEEITHISHNGNQGVYIIDSSGAKDPNATFKKLVDAFKGLGSEKTEDDIGSHKAVMTESKDLGLAGINKLVKSSEYAGPGF